MKSNPFLKRELIRATLFHKHTDENYLIELENLLYDSFPNLPVDLSALTKYKVKIEKLKPQLLALWERACGVLECSDLGVLTSQNDTEMMNRLAELLTLTDQEKQTVMEAIGAKKIRHICQQVVSDKDFDTNTFFHHEEGGKVNRQEALAITQLTKQYNIGDSEIVVKLITEAATEYFTTLVEDVCADSKLTSEEVKRVFEALERLRVIDINQFPKFALIYLIYQVDTETLSPLSNSDINVPKGEIVFAGQVGGVTLHEWRKERTGAVMYAGPRYVMRSGIPGLTYRIGGYHISAPSKDVLKVIDEGSIYFTNKRVIFNGTKKSVSIKMKDILKFDVDFSGNMVLERANGKSIYLEFNPTVKPNRSHPALFNALLEKYAGQ